MLAEKCVPIKEIRGMAPDPFYVALPPSDFAKGANDFGRKTVAQDAGRNTADHGIRLDIAGNHRAGGNDCAVTDGHAVQDQGSVANRGTLAELLLADKRQGKSPVVR